MTNYNIVPATTILVAVVLLLSSGFSIGSKSRSTNDTMCQTMVEPQGYACQEHTVTTKDGYILSLQRIPQGRSGNNATKPPVLLQHGLVMDGASWLVNPPSQSLAFVLADNGFDVWIANSRGTRFSRRHISLNTSDPRYWEWSWEELGRNDLPATVDYVHNHTGQNLHFVGHSLGSLMAIAPLSENNVEVFRHLRSVAFLGPIAFLEHIMPIIVNFSTSILDTQEYWKGVHEFDPKSPEVAVFVKNICLEGEHFRNFDCSDLFEDLTGPNCCINRDAMGKLQLQSTSVKNMIHISQMVGKSSVNMFDYGKDENLRRYGFYEPPAFEIGTYVYGLPTMMVSGRFDGVSDPEDLEHLIDELHPDAELLLLSEYKFAHADFVFASNATDIVYAPIINFFSRH